MKEKKEMVEQNDRTKTSVDERENDHLRELLKKAVNQDQAPESLREKIRKMILVS
jgi:hypothetical protein